MNKRSVIYSFKVSLIILTLFIIIFNLSLIKGEQAKEINVFTFNQTNLSKSYSDLERARAYSSFFTVCELEYPNQKCNLKQNEFDSICSDLAELQVPNGDCYIFYKLYLANEVKKIRVSEGLADQYNLIESAEVKERSLFWWILIPSAILVILFCVLLYTFRKIRKRK